jgi:hypothetical protein
MQEIYFTCCKVNMLRAGCSSTSQTFAGSNPDFNVNIFEGSTGVNP